MLLGTRHQRAAILIVVLGVALLYALAPFATGLLGIPVLYVIARPVYRWLVQVGAGERLASAVVIVLALAVLILPGMMFAGLVASEAQNIATNLAQSPLLTRLTQLQIGQVHVGEQIAGMGERIANWIASSVFGLIGAVTRLALNVVIALFGLYYLLPHSTEAWEALTPYIPFSARNTDRLLKRFEDVTISTAIGTGAVAAIHGLLVGMAFWATGLSQGVFWGVVTAVLSILPVVGSGLVWGPGAIALWLAGREAYAAGMVVWGLVVVGNVEYLVRPLIFKRWAHIHPVITLVGALAGVPYFGILGLLIGPLALSYFFELIRMYEVEYLAQTARTPDGQGDAETPRR